MPEMRRTRTRRSVLVVRPRSIPGPALRSRRPSRRQSTPHPHHDRITEALVRVVPTPVLRNDHRVLEQKVMSEGPEQGDAVLPTVRTESNAVPSRGLRPQETRTGPPCVVSMIVPWNASTTTPCSSVSACRGTPSRIEDFCLAGAPREALEFVDPQRYTLLRDTRDRDADQKREQPGAGRIIESLLTDSSRLDVRIDKPACHCDTIRSTGTGRHSGPGCGFLRGPIQPLSLSAP